MTAPNMAEKVWRGTPSQSAQVPYSVVSFISVSPTSKTTARTRGATDSSAKRGFPPGSDERQALIQLLDRCSILPRPDQFAELVYPFRAGRIPGLGERNRSFSRQLAALVDLALVHERGRKIGQEHGALLHRAG